MATAIQFNKLVRHGRIVFTPGLICAFEDADAAPYFIAAGWASAVGVAEPQVTFTLGEIDIDPDTIFGDGPNKGRKVVEAE